MPQVFDPFHGSQVLPTQTPLAVQHTRYSCRHELRQYGERHWRIWSVVLGNPERGRGRVGDRRALRLVWGAAVAGGFRSVPVPQSSPWPRFLVPALRTRHADFPHRALQWDHAPRTRATGSGWGQDRRYRLTMAAARRPSCLPRRFRCAARPVHAPAASNRSGSTPSLPHVTRSELFALEAGL